MKPRFDHNAYAKKVKTLEDVTLRYIIKDCKEAIAANPDGENVSYYLDEVNYCANELYRRQKNAEC